MNADTFGRKMPKRKAADETRFITVDLDLVARHDLSALVEALSPRMHVLFNARVGRRFHATLELGGAAAISGTRIASSPDMIITRMVQLIAKLPRARRAEWNAATERAFNLGFESGRTRLAPVVLKPSTVRVVAGVGGSIVVTLYPLADAVDPASQ